MSDTEKEGGAEGGDTTETSVETPGGATVEETTPAENGGESSEADGE